MFRSLRSLLLAIPCVVAAGVGSAQVFPGSGFGAIPDGLAGTPPQYGSPRVVSFTVSGLSQSVSHVTVSVSLTHTWVGDVDMVLAAPGGSPAVALASRIGVTTAGGFGDSSNYGGFYLFNDGAPGANIWTVAASACDSACTVAPGIYRTTAGGTAGQANPAPFTSLNATFAGLQPAQANGTWTLTVRDAAPADVGTVSAGSLAISTAPLVISEFRLIGPNGVNDEYVEILNNSAAPHTVAATSGSGYGVAASDGVTRCTLPNGTVIPARGHFLCANSVGYSLSAYPAGSGTSATADATFATDIPLNTGLAVFNNNTGGGAYSIVNRLDAAGFTAEANTLYKEGTGLPNLSPFSIDHAFYRDDCDKQGSITTFGPCPSGGFVIDGGNNAIDFIFVDTNGTSAGAGQRLGSPGPQNLSSPLFGGGSFGQQAFDPCVGAADPPNLVRDFTSDSGNNSTFGTLELRRTFTNTTGAPITRLRFRVIDQTTFPAPSGIADLRTRTTSATVSSVDRPPCGTGASMVTVEGTTLEQPPSQPNGGAFNGSFSAEAISLATPLANGASVDLRFLFGIQQTGRAKLALAAESLPVGSNAVFQFNGCTDAPCPGFAKGDFDNDGQADIVFRSVVAGQQNKVWYMNARTRVGEAAISPDAASADWLIRGVDDFDGDDGNDLAFWNQATGAVEFWLMNGVARDGAAVPLGGAAPLPTNWDLSATADFNGDDRPDLVWRNFTSQNIVIWTMNGTTKVGNVIPTPDQAVNANWIIVAAADYTADGNTDLLWYNFSSGKIVTWYMNASAVRTSGQFTTPDAAGDNNWKVVASADFSASAMPGTPPAGSPDILWRNATSGNQVVWHLNFNSARVHGEFTDPVANSPALDWVIVGPR